MTNSERTNLFISTNDTQTIKEYHDKLFENLKDLNEKEEKYAICQYGIVFLYLLASNISLNTLNLGPFTIPDINAVIKILPLAFVYLLCILHSITLQKKELAVAFEIISLRRFNDIPNTENVHSYLSRIYRPYAFKNALSNLLNAKPHKIEAFIEFIISLPIIAIGLAPYFIIITMLIDLYTNYQTDNLGRLSFYITVCISALIIFHLAIETFKSQK